MMEYAANFPQLTNVIIDQKEIIEIAGVLLSIFVIIYGGVKRLPGITSSPDFILSIDPMEGQIRSGGSRQIKITLNPSSSPYWLHRFKYQIRLGERGNPDEIVFTFEPQKFYPPIGGIGKSSESLAIINVGNNVPAGDYPVEIFGKSQNGLEHSCTYYLEVKGRLRSIETPPETTDELSLSLGDAKYSFALPPKKK
ncbi:MAG: hypothetical protein ACP5PV_10370 [Methanothrix sp.]